MRRLWIVFGLILMLMVGGLSPVTAQPAEWEAWMYNYNNGRMIRVGSDRAIYDDFTLPGLQGNTYSTQIVVSPDGRTVLYTLNNQNNGIVTVYAYDLLQKAISASYIIPSQPNQLVYTNIDLTAGPEIFSPDSTSVAFGYTIDGEWTLIVMDLFSAPGSILLQLDESDPSMSGVAEIAIDVPMIRNYDGFVVDFNIIPAATEGFPAYNHYQYDTRTNSLSQQIYFTIPFGSFNPRNGSYVFPISDFRTTPPDNRYQQFGEHTNSLQVYQLGTNSIYPIFYTPNTEVGLPYWIQNGEKILFRTYDASTQSTDWFIMEDLGAGQIQLFTLSRLTNFFPSGVQSTGNGMLMSMNANDSTATFPELASYPNQTVLMSFDTRADNLLNNSGTIVWISEQNQSYDLVWVEDNQADIRAIPPVFSPQGPSVDATTYGTLSQFAANLQATIGSSTPAQNAGSLTIGGQAQIFTTDGDRANMRSAASLSGQIVDRLNNGVIVTIISGPQSNDGFVWWQVQSGTTIGWVVESADGVRVLQPYGVVPTSVPTTIVPPPISSNPTLFVGGTAVVTTDGNNLNARQQATTTARIVAVYQTGESLNIVGGPFENEGFVWWQVDTQFGPAWVAEGTATENWIIGGAG